MGLDMYLFSRSSPDAQPERIGYWRKHRNLHRLIEQWWQEACCPDDHGEGFNCIPFRLTREQCEEILRLSEAHAVPQGEPGFFFGESELSDDEETAEIMRKALEAIDAGQEVYYDSWW